MGVGVGGEEEQAGGAHSGGWWGRRRERGGVQRQRGGDRRLGRRHHGGGGCGRPPPRQWPVPRLGTHRRRGCTARHGANKKRDMRWHPAARGPCDGGTACRGCAGTGSPPGRRHRVAGGACPRGPASRRAASPCHARRRGPSPPAVAAAAGGHGGGEGDGRPVIRRHPHLDAHASRIGYVTTAGMGRRRHVDDEGAPLPCRLGRGVGQCRGAWQAASAAPLVGGCTATLRVPRGLHRARSGTHCCMGRVSSEIAMDCARPPGRSVKASARHSRADRTPRPADARACLRRHEEPLT